jgi:dienelactone hydrolase
MFAGHRTACRNTASQADKEAAALAWKRAIEFFNKQLRA